MWARLLLTLGLSVCLVTVLVSYIVSAHDTRKLFAEIQQLESAQRELNTEWGRLQLEKSTLVGNNRIERVAKERLGMILPQDEHIVVIKR